MDTEVYKIRIDQWRKLIYEANTCGMKKTEWCRQNGVTLKQFYYWQKKIRALALKEMSDGIGMDDAIHRDDPTICCIIKIPKVADKNGEHCISILEKIAG